MSTPKPNNLVVTNAGAGTRHDSALSPLKLPFIATPLGMMIIIPLLVGGAAVGALGLYHLTMQGGVREMGRNRVVSDATVVQQRAILALGEVSALVDGVHAWADHAGTASATPQVARALIGMADARPGVSQVYIGRPDGGMLGVTHLEGVWQVIQVVPGTDGATRTFSQLQADGSMLQVAIEKHVAFDARLRPWYQQAVASPSRVWTGPYRSARSGTPGVTIARQLAPLEPGQPPRGVVAVDLDFATFGGFLQRRGDLGSNLVFNREMELIAIPPEMLTEVPSTGLPTGANLRDPVVRTFFAAIQTLPVDDALLPVRVAIEGVEYGGFVQRLPIPDGPAWFIAQVATRDAIVGVMDRAKLKGLLGAAGAIAIGLLAGLFFAGLLARAKREIDVQRGRARAAEAKARELGSYNLIRKIGEGGMGQVWIGEHRMLSRQAAIKLISPAALANVAPDEVEEVRKRFEQEARITASLRARSTVELYDFGVAPDGTFFYVMELLDGMDLRQLVEKHGPLPAGRVVHILANALTSLAEAHDRGLVHRDIKPENIFICRRSDETDVVKVLDFGLVRLAKAPDNARLTAAGMVTGTPSTMAPEQALGRELDGRCDLYALGCVACWLLTGSDVFVAGSAIELLTMHINERPQPLRERNPAVPEELARLIEACLEKDPAKRPPDARTLAQALESLVLPPGQSWTPRRAQDWWDQLPKPAPSTRERDILAPSVVGMDV